MKIHPSWPAAAVFCGLLLSAWGSAHAACPTLTPAQARDQHSMVFLGTVEAVKDSVVKPSASGKDVSGTWRIARVRMSSIWKGPARREIWVLSKLAPETPKLALGETYVIYADTVSYGCVFERCSRTRPYAKATEDVKALGQPAIVQRVPGRGPSTK